MVSTSIYLTPEQADRLAALYERSKVPTAVVVRDGVDAALEVWEARFPVTPAKAASGGGGT